MKIQAHCELTRVLAEIVSECRNGCTDARSTVEHFERIQKNPTRAIPDLNMLDVVEIIKILNFAAIRENSETLTELIAKAG